MLGALTSTLVIGGLVYLSLFVEPTLEEFIDDAPPIEQRDVFFDIAVISAESVLVAGQHGKIVRSDDSGSSWVQLSVPVTAHLQSIDAWNDERAVAVGNGVTALFTDDGGSTWRKGVVPVDEIGDEVISRDEIKLLKVRAFPETKAWAVGEMGLVLRSIDSGQHWQRLDVGEPDAWASWNDIDFNGDHGWMVGEFARIRRTTDGGRTWSEVTAPIASSLNAVRFRDSAHGVAVGTSGVILTTADGGKNWQQAPEITREHLFDLHWTGEQWLAVGDNGVLLISTPDAASWVPVSYRSNGTTWHSAVGELEDFYLLVGARINKISRGGVVTGQ